MELLERVLLVHESESPREALRGLAERAPVRAAAWIDPTGQRTEGWPEGALLPLPAEAAGVPSEPELRRTPTGEGILLIPLGDDLGALVLEGEARELGGSQEGWRRVGDAFTLLARRTRLLRAMEEERDALRQRAEESEALHVLGLAANRSLDPDEVLNLVSRFTRTLLGAHYVTVSTVEEDEEVCTVAAIGLRTEEGDRDHDPFAAEVIRRGKPITVGDQEGDDSRSRYHFHAEEGMQVGLGVPLSLFGNTFGALVVGYRRAYQIKPRDTRLALTLAGHAAVAISNARLHRTLADRSRELERAYQELRWTTQAKERFFASMSHELRTPLNAILGYQSLLLEDIAGRLKEQQRSFVQSAQRATQALLLLVNDVLDLSKIEAGKMELVVRSVALREILEDALATVHPLADSKGIGLEVCELDDLPTLSTDADRVRQILLNLLSNAIKFTDQGEVSLAVEVETADPSNSPFPLSEHDGAEIEGWVEIRVTDTGPGIEPEHHERIFHEFEQVVGISSRGGTGLGLPISRKLARLLGGDLQLRSTPGAGSTFVLSLPLRAESESGTRVASARETS